MAAKYKVALVPSKGRCCVATAPLEVGEEVSCTRPEIAVLYTTFTTITCARCFVDSVQEGFICESCNRFVLCSKCALISGLLEWHTRECELFCSIPAAMRTGDTDYIRFILRYFTILNYGMTPSTPNAIGECSDAVLNNFQDLCTNKEHQSEDTLAWCIQFANLIAKFIPLPRGITISSLVDLLLRIRSNTIGFPFNKDETIGWCLDSKASMFNHSCDPNCYITSGVDGTLVVKTNKNVPRANELCISYIDLLLDQFKDVKTRREHLNNAYRFLCSCVRCRKEQPNK